MTLYGLTLTSDERSTLERALQESLNALRTREMIFNDFNQNEQFSEINTEWLLNDCRSDIEKTELLLEKVLDHMEVVA